MRKKKTHDIQACDRPVFERFIERCFSRGIYSVFTKKQIDVILRRSGLPGIERSGISFMCSGFAFFDVIGGFAGNKKQPYHLMELMNMFKASELFDMEHTLAAELFKSVKYPWDVLPLIGDFIKSLGPQLSDSEYDHPSENVWIAKSADIAASASITGHASCAPERSLDTARLSGATL